MSQGPLELQDPEFWTTPFRTKGDVGFRLADEGRFGIVIDAPTQVPLDSCTTAPVVTLQVAEGAQAAAAPIASLGVIVAARLHGQSVEAAILVPSDDDQVRAGDGAPPPPPPPDLVVVHGACTDLRERVELPWEPDDVVVTVLLRDKASNRVRVALGPSSHAFRDPEVERYLDEKRKQAPPWPLSPPLVRGTPLPSYEKQPESPPVPDAHGIAVVAPRIVEQRPDTTVIVRGSFRLPLAAGRSVRAEHHASYPYGAPAAVAPVTLVITGSVVAAPFVFRLVCPASVAAGAGGGQDLVGHFALDLQQLGNLKHAVQTNFLYAFAHDVMSGPAPIAVVADTHRPR